MRAFTLVWDAWSGITRRHVYYAMLAGFTVATAEGIGAAVWQQRFPWWRSFFAMFVPGLLQAFVLLLCLSVAARVSTNRVPRWAPFVIAAALGTLLTCVLDVTIIGNWLLGMNFSFNALWFNLPTYMLIGILAALGYMHGIDAQQRTLVLRNVQFERTWMARDAYESRLKSLQARVEPRFLFDTLADIESLYEARPERAQRLLDDLIVYLRAALPGLNDGTSSLSAELTLARMWLDIMRVRDGDGLSYSVEEPAPAHDVRMPPMLLLPLVQQAFASSTGGPSERPDVAVVAEVTDVRVRVVVTAAGLAFATGVTAEANALVRERLQSLYGAKATLEFRIVGGGMSEATLEIPHEPANRRHR